MAARWSCHLAPVSACTGPRLSSSAMPSPIGMGEEGRCGVALLECESMPDCVGVYASGRSRCRSMTCKATRRAFGHCVAFPSRGIPSEPHPLVSYTRNGKELFQYARQSQCVTRIHAPATQMRLEFCSFEAVVKFGRTRHLRHKDRLCDGDAYCYARRYPDLALAFCNHPAESFIHRPCELSCQSIKLFEHFDAVGKHEHRSFGCRENVPDPRWACNRALAAQVNDKRFRALQPLALGAVRELERIRKWDALKVKQSVAIDHRAISCSAADRS